MKKYLFLLAIVALWIPQGHAQRYFVSSLATPGAAFFSAGQDQDGVISFPCDAGTHTIEVETNQEATVSCDAEWCDASIKGKTLTLAVTENDGEEDRSAELVIHSKDFHPLIITIHQEKTDNPYASVSNNFVRTFTKRTKNMPQELVMKELGKLNAIKKAYQLTEFPFVPTGVIESNKGSYLPGVEYKGMIYSSTKEIGTSVPNAVSFYTFATAVRNPRSKLYTDHINELPYHGTNCRAYYGTVCSSLVSYALGESFNSYGFVESDLMEDIGYKVPEDVEVGDVLWKTDHVAIITDMLRDEDGQVKMVEFSEALQGGCVTRQYDRKQFNNSMTNRFEKVLRYSFFENNTKYEAFPQFVPVLEEESVAMEYNEELCVDKGDCSNYLIGEDVTINIFTPYDSVTVYKDDERYASFTMGNEVGDVALSNLPYGIYSASLWLNHQESKETSWMVVDYNVSYDQEEQVIHFSSHNATPTFVRQCSLTGAQGSMTNQLLGRAITPEELVSGCVIVSSGQFLDDKYSYIQMIFKTDFGTISTRPIKAIPDTVFFFAGQDQDGVISLPCDASTHTIEVEINQEVTVSCDDEWCDVSIKGKTLTLTVTENDGNEARSTVLTVKSKDYHPLLLTIRQDKTDNPYVSVSNNFVRTFTKRTKNMPQEIVMKEHGKLNAIKKAYQLTKFPFMPVGVIENNKGSYLPGVEYKGMIYSSTKEIGTSVPDAVSFYTFATAARNPRSKLYTDHINELPYHGTNCRAYYGTVCSSLVSYALGESLNSYGFAESDLMEEIGYNVPEDVEVGDVLWLTDHVALITDMLRDEDGQVKMVEISEATQEGSVTRQYNRKQFINRMTNRFEKVLRYRCFENNTKYEAFPQFVPVVEEEFVSMEYNEDLCVDKGDCSNYLIGEDVTINIFSPYDSVTVYRGDERCASFTTGNEQGDVTLTSLPYGTYSASLWLNNQKSKETSWMVVDYNVSYDQEEQVIHFSSQNATPTSIRQCALTGRQGSMTSQLLGRAISSEELASGCIIVPSEQFLDDKYSYIQMKFKTDFGTVSTRPIKATN